MSLWSFIEERCKAKGIKPFDLVDAGVSRATLYRIQDGGTPGDRVKAQLSVGLGCSIGEINEAISQADQTTPFGETVKKTKKKESVMETVDKLEEMITPEPEEVYELTEEEIDVKPLLLETTAADYQGYLRGLILQQLIEAEPGTMVENLWVSIGRLVAREVL